MSGTYNLCIPQGSTYTKVFTWSTGSCCGCSTVGAAPQLVDLTGYSAAMQIRPFALASAPVLYDASADLVLGGAAGTITLSIPAASTDEFTWWNGVYDLLVIDPSGNVTRLLSGTVAISAAVTQLGGSWTADSTVVTADSKVYQAA